MRADLHLHTVFSDGLYMPEEIAFRAKEAGLQLIAFTDHDSMEGRREKEAAAEKYGLKSVSGWEVSAYDDCKVHILGYCCRKEGAYEAFSARLERGARKRAEEMIKKGNACFQTHITMEDALAQILDPRASLHTMHIVRAFAKAVCRPDGELYREYFSRGKPAYSALGRPSPEEAIEVIHAAGGIASLAHPGRIELGFQEREELFDRLVSCGLDGIECFYTSHTVTETEYFLRYADRKNLLKTGGSDFHAEDGAHHVGLPCFEADERLLEAFSSRGGIV